MFRLLWMRYKIYINYKKYSKSIKDGNHVLEMRYNNIIKELEEDIRLDELRYFYGQSLFVFCPNCGDELLSQRTDIERKDYANNISIDTITCNKCNHTDEWVNGILPLPTLKSRIGKIKEIDEDGYKKSF